MSKISFEDIGAVVATFLVDGDVKGGQVVKVSADGTVAPCSDGDAFCGVALEPRKGAAGVQVKGFVTVSAQSKLSLGWQELAADGNGGVKSGEGSGVRALVVSAEDSGAVILL